MDYIRPGLSKGRIQREDENEKNRPPTYTYSLIVGYCRLVGTDEWILAPFWLPIRPFILSLVDRRIDFLGKKYSPMYRRIKLKDTFKIEQVALPTKLISLRPRIHNSTGRLYLVWLLPTRNDPLDVSSGRPINKSVGFLTKKLNMSNIFRRPIRGILSRPDKSF